MKRLRNILTVVLLAFGMLLPATVRAENTVDVKEIVFGHIGDSYEWHITTWGETHVTIPLPVIVHSSTTGWHVFLSSRLEENGGSYEGFSIAPAGSKYEGKLVEHDATGNEIRPLDISITKVTLALLINSALLLVIILSVAHWYRKHPQGSAAPGGFIGFMEMFIMMVNDDIIKSCVGPKYRKFAPYLLTAFFFIFINNIMGLIPFFPGGANVTGNIAITMVLAICTFLAVNIFGTKTYWKDIFWPDVPWWLKVPVPMMPFIEFFGIFTKPFALMIRLFANMLAGHMAMLVLTCLIFISASMGPALNGTLTVEAYQTRAKAIEAQKPAKRVSASTNPEDAENVLDEKINTVWQGNKGDYITFALKNGAKVDKVAIAFTRDNNLPATFEIQLSGGGGQFLTVYSSTVSEYGKLISYPFKGTTASDLRIVLNDDRVSIAKVKF